MDRGRIGVHLHCSHQVRRQTTPGASGSIWSYLESMGSHNAFPDYVNHGLEIGGGLT